MLTNNLNPLEDENKKDLIKDKSNKIVGTLLEKHYVLFEEASDDFAERDYALSRLQLTCNDLEQQFKEKEEELIKMM